MTQLIETVSRPYFESITAYGRRHEEVVVLSGDLTKSCEADGYAAEFPDRYYNLGMDEQNIVGMAAGMAREGILPVVHTFGVFISRRAFDQVQMSVGVPRVRVRLLGFLSGITTPGGVTHQAIDDVAIMASVPGLTILDPGDATEIETVLEAAHDLPGPVYFRMMRGDLPRYFDSPLEIGKVRVLEEGTDLAVFSASVGTWEAIEAVKSLKASGVSVAHVHVSTLKPFDDPEIRRVLSGVTGVITVENHLVHGGLGSAIAATMAETGTGGRLVRLGLQDRFGGAGRLPYLIDQCGFSARHIVEAAGRLLGRDFGGAGVQGVTEVGEGDLERQEAL
jgi:transketolase